MQERVKTSFIPKASFKSERRDSVRTTTYGVVNVIAGVLLLTALFASAGLFFFEQYIQSSIESKRESLDRARAAFQPETIQELARLDSRLSVSNTLLAAHIAPSRLFDVIEETTLTSVRFNDFTFKEDSPGRMSLAMAGEARSFNALALQADAFSQSGMFSEIIFENLNIDPMGNVVFDFSAIVNTAELDYVARPVRTQPQQPLDIETSETPGASQSETNL